MNNRDVHHWDLDLALLFQIQKNVGTKFVKQFRQLILDRVGEGQTENPRRLEAAPLHSLVVGEVHHACSCDSCGSGKIEIPNLKYHSHIWL